MIEELRKEVRDMQEALEGYRARNDVEMKEMRGIILDLIKKLDSDKYNWGVFMRKTDNEIEKLHGYLREVVMVAERDE